MKAFDVHTHTNSNELIEEFENIYNESQKLNLWFNIVGCTLEDSKIASKQVLDKNNIFATVGIHPTNCNNLDNIDFEIKELEKLILSNKKIVAIGEVGLDYYYEDTNKENQKICFIKQIELAIKHNLSLMCHIREAHEDAIEILKQYKDKLNIIIHCFSANTKVMKQYTSLGCYISIPGIVTFKNAHESREMLKELNLNRILFETDAPYLAPVPFRGKMNKPYYVLNTIEFVANHLNIEENELKEISFNNSLKALNIKE